MILNLGICQIFPIISVTILFFPISSGVFVSNSNMYSVPVTLAVGLFTHAEKNRLDFYKVILRSVLKLEVEYGIGNILMTCQCKVMMDDRCSGIFLFY